MNQQSPALIDFAVCRVVHGDAGLVALGGATQTSVTGLAATVVTVEVDLVALGTAVDDRLSKSLGGTVAADVAVQGSLAVTGNVGFFGSAPATQQAVDALTNNVTAGGVDGTVADYTDLIVYATDAAAIRNNLFQLARAVYQLQNALAAYGLLAP